MAGGMSAPAGTTANLAKTAAQETAVAKGLETAGGQVLPPAMTSLGTAGGTMGQFLIFQNRVKSINIKPALAAGAATVLGMLPITPEFKDEGPEPPEGLQIW